MIDEIVKAVRLHLSERLTSPLFGAIAVAWIVWNYRAVLVVLSGEPVLRKFEIIDQLLYPTALSVTLKCVLLPVGTALVYLFIYPFPAKYVYQFTRQKQREILDVRRKIEGETPLTVEDSRRLRNDLAKAEQTYYAELDRKDSELEKLKQQIILLNDAGSKAQVEPAPAHEAPRQSSSFEPEVIRMLEIMEDASGKLSDRGAITASGLSKVEAEFVLGELRRLGLASRVLDRSKREYFYHFTHDGRAALLAAKQRSSEEEDA